MALLRLTDISLAQSTAITPTTLIHIVTTGDTTQFSGGSSYKAELGQLTSIFSGSPQIYTTAFTYSNNTFTIFDNSGSTFSQTVNDFSGLTINGNLNVTGDTILNNITATTISATTYQNLPIDPDTYTTGFTYSANTFTILDNSGNTFNATISDVTGLTVNGGLSATTLSAVTIGSSGDCVDDLYVSNIHSCSPLYINPLSEGNVFVGSANTLTIDLINERVGIGITTPSEKLEVSGDSLINSFILGRGNGDNINNMAFGKDALFTNTGGTRNTAIGYESLYSLLSTNGNTALGYETLRNNVGSDNTAIGADVLRNNTTGSGNVGVGRNSLNANQTGNNNIAIDGATGSLITNQSGSQNIGIGGYSLYIQNGVSGSVAIGWSSLYQNASGTGNSAVGFESLRVATGNNNTAFGYQAGTTHTTGNNNTFIGNNTDSTTTGITNSTAIGYNTKTSQSNTVILGNSADVGIGTSTPSSKLEVSGRTKTINFTMTSGATNGYVLTSDASGNASWSQSTTFTGGTVTGATIFTGGVSANTISATTYQSTISNTQVVYSNNGTLTGSTAMTWTNSATTLSITGTLEATSKSFVIPHPTKEGKKLVYGSLEGPENGVYHRGKLTNENTILLPEYWSKLVDKNTVTVNLTPIGRFQNLYVKEVLSDKIIVDIESGLFGNKTIECYYTVYGERKDTDKLVIER